MTFGCQYLACARKKWSVRSVFQMCMEDGVDSRALEMLNLYLVALQVKKYSIVSRPLILLSLAALGAKLDALYACPRVW